MGLKQALIVIASVAVVSAGVEDVSGNFILSRTRRSPLHLNLGYSHSNSGEHYSPYFHADYSYSSPNYLHFRPSPNRFNYHYDIHHGRSPFYGSHGFYPGSNYYNDDSDMNWITPNQPLPISSTHRKTPGAYVWIPLDTLQHHRALQRQLELEIQHEREQQLHLINLHHQVLLEREQATTAHHNVPLLDNHDAVFIPHTGVDSTFFPLAYDESFNGIQNSNIVPLAELGLELLSLEHSGFVPQPINMFSSEEPSLMLLPPTKPTLVPLPIKHSKKPSIIPIAPRPSTTLSPSIEPTVSVPTSRPKSASISIINTPEEQLPVGSIVSNEISKRSPTILREKKNDVENPKTNL